jgi:hypothetical protein
MYLQNGGYHVPVSSINLSGCIALTTSRFSFVFIEQPLTLQLVMQALLEPYAFFLKKNFFLTIHESPSPSDIQREVDGKFVGINIVRLATYHFLEFRD